MVQIKIDETTGAELISVSEVKNYVRIDTTADDDLIGLMITSARIQAENYCSRDFVAKERTYYVDESLDGIIDLPFGPVGNVISVTVDGVATTAYELLGITDKTLVLNAGFGKKIQINYTTTGMTDGLLKQVMMQMVSTLYDNRTDFVTGTIVSTLDSNFKAILSGYRNVFV